METNKKVPSLDKLILLAKKDGFYSEGYEFQLQEVINIVNYSEGFKYYLQENKFDEDYNHSYYIFGLIIQYINICYKNNKIEQIEEIFSYLDIMSKKDNEYILDLLYAGALEVFDNLDNYKINLPKLVKLMPLNLKKIFKKIFGNHISI